MATHPSILAWRIPWTSILFSTVAAPVYIPTVQAGLLFLTSSLILVSSLLDNSQSNRCEVTYIPSKINNVQYLFIFFLAICVFCWRNVYSDLLPIFFFFLSIELYEFFIYVGYQSLIRYDSQILSVIQQVVFLLTVSFAGYKLFSLMQSHIFSFAFIAIVLGVKFNNKNNNKKSLCKGVNVYVFFQKFVVSGLTFKSLIHLVLIYSVWGKILIHFHSFLYN